MKRITDDLGADVAIDAVGAEADGNLTPAHHVGEAQAAGRFAGRAELGDRLGAQGRERLGDGRLRSAVQRGQVRRRDEQGPDHPHEPGARQAPVAAAVRAHPATATSSRATSSRTASPSRTSPRATTCSRPSSTTASSRSSCPPPPEGATMAYTADKPALTAELRRAARTHPRLGRRPRSRRPPVVPAGAHRPRDGRALGLPRAAARELRRASARSSTSS